MTNIYWEEPQLSDGDMPSNRKTVGLINYEGDVLKLYKVHINEYVIYDQWDSIVEIVNLKDLCEWLEGKTALVDSNGKQWIFTDHKDACQSLYNIFRYMTI